MTKITSGTAITADGEFGIDIPQTGWYRVQVGGNQDSFGGGNATVKQESHVYDGFSAITSSVAKVCCLRQGHVVCAVDGSTSPSLQFFVEKLR